MACRREVRAGRLGPALEGSKLGVELDWAVWQLAEEPPHGGVVCPNSVKMKEHIY